MIYAEHYWSGGWWNNSKKKKRATHLRTRNLKKSEADEACITHHRTLILPVDPAYANHTTRTSSLYTSTAKKVTCR